MGGSIDQQDFQRILKRNVALPLGLGVFSALIFAGMIAYLLQVLSWVEHTDRVIASANETSKLTVDMETGMRGFLISGDESFLTPYLTAGPLVQGKLDALTALVADNPTQVERLRRISAAELQWNNYASEIIALRRGGGAYAEAVRAGRGKALSDEMRQLFSNLLDTEQSLLRQRGAQARSDTMWAVSLYLVFSLLVAALLALFGRRELLRLSNSYNEALGHQATHNALLEHQAWLRSGQSELATRAAEQRTMAGLAEATLGQLTRYLGGMVGAMYVREDNGVLRRVAGYAFDSAQEPRARQFDPAASLLGQAVAENRILLLDELPDTYLKISSALGETLPRHVLIAPFSNEGRVAGALEIGFLRPVPARATELLALVADNIGAAVAAASYRQRLQDVLSETQQLNEELQVQQEELRSANEELEEQSRVLEVSQSNLQNQQAELEQTNEQLAEQALSLDHKNSALSLAQEQLRERALELERTSRYKSEFLANMSHELRTPLNSSLILAKLLSDNQAGNLNEEQVRFAQTIYSAGNDLLLLINDILDISKVEAGKLELAPEDVPLRRMADGLIQVFAPVAAQKSLSLSAQIDPAVPATLYSDRQRIEQVLKNLLSNALKFTDTGGVTLHLSPDQDGGVRITVQDSGIGIAADQQERIFDAFHQADGTTSRRYGGTGLGLSISRDLTRLLGGALHVASVPGEGSCFTLLLPASVPAAPTAPLTAAPATPRQPPAPRASAAEAAAAPAPAAPQFPDDRDRPAAGARTVLVVEDELAFAQILFKLAHEMGYRCLVALSADEGLEMARRHFPDAVLLDVRLPDRSGLSVLQLLKDNPLTRHIPVHMVSSLESSGEAMLMGAIGYARKPTTREELEGIFRKLEEKFTQQVKRVLLVEDDARQRDSVVQLIADSDVQIAAVGTGEEALRLLRSETFDCMIIDLKLPDMQGNELLERMSNEEICAFPPVIVYTGRNLTRDEENALMKYSRSIIIKGARSPERLLDEVTLFLHKVESTLSNERQGMLKAVRSRDRVFEGRTILLVDDDVRNVFALTSALEQRGAKVEIGRNGFEALAKLEQVSTIDLVLMDVMMPGMDGLEATRRIRAQPRHARLPIIAITAKAMKDDQEQCIAAGANDYMAKPIDLNRLYSLLRVWMPNLERL